MMRVAEVIDRLKDQLVPATFVAVGSLSEVPAKPEGMRWTRRAFVQPQADRVGENTAGTGVVSQRAVCVVRVLIGFTRQTQRGMGDLDSVQDVVEAVKAALIGWTPTGEHAPVHYIGAGIEYGDIINGILIWGVDVGCPYYLEA